MLSILIPTYNFDVSPLVTELYNQCLEAKIEFEIIVQDDASNSSINSENEKINTLKNCFFNSNLKNLGRAENRNSLAAKAKFDWILFLDADTFPNNNHFIQNYIDTIPKHSIVFGGLQYQTEKPEQFQLLRWVYGKKREAIILNRRVSNPYRTALTSNILIKKDVFNLNKFDKNIKKYGYEDFLFFCVLEQKQIKIKHIENSVIHLGLETSDEFIKKTKLSAENLVTIHKLNPKLVSQNRIIKTYGKLNFLRLMIFYDVFFNLFKSKMEHNLVSKNPSLFIFDLYKLGCFVKKIKS